jgi:exodeoxyribonuclease VII large subunit
MEPTTTIKGIRLSELGNKIKEVLDNAFQHLSFWVIADVSNHTFRPDKNYHFFQLVEKDENSNVILARVEGKAWGYGSGKIREFEDITGQKFSNGLQVLVNIKVVYSSAYGLQVELQGIDPNFTLGNIEKQRKETLRLLLTNNPDVIQLVGDEYITRNKGLKMKAVLQHIAVISSKDSAGLTDFLHTLRNNTFGYQFGIDVYHTHVQGDERANEMKTKIIEVFTSGISYDALVILRGGGSDTDFLIFDNYQVALAIARFPIPVICGIGHQKNITIVDLMAHTSTKTPTKAAEFIIARNRSFEDQLINLRNNIVIKTQQMMALRNQQLNQTYKGITEGSSRFLSSQKEMMVEYFQIITVKTKHLMFERKTLLQDMFRKVTTRPIVISAQQKALLENQRNKILESSPIFLKHARGYLGHFVKVIELARPEKILNMGFALIRQDGKYITQKAKLKSGKEFEVIMNDGTIKAKS